jgi:hypothetical protein
VTLPAADRCGLAAHLHEELGDLRELQTQHGAARDAFGNLRRQMNHSKRFAHSDFALGYAYTALASLPPSASPEARAPYQFALGFNLLWNGNHTEAEAELRVALDLAEKTGDVAFPWRPGHRAADQLFLILSRKDRSLKRW